MAEWLILLIPLLLLPILYLACFTGCAQGAPDEELRTRILMTANYRFEDEIERLQVQHVVFTVTGETDPAFERELIVTTPIITADGELYQGEIADRDAGRYTVRCQVYGEISEGTSGFWGEAECRSFNLREAAKLEVKFDVTTTDTTPAVAVAPGGCPGSA